VTVVADDDLPRKRQKSRRLKNPAEPRGLTSAYGGAQRKDR
jgi:hypothetical protein